ncbi:SIS domain-containing protein [Clostridium chromiireducens]|uniref:SIS domain-containing protein n=1 Tax=Clostridium chromiireducens TaxID=225345 RepID=A0A964RIJ6_9CLOT|nr:SIS domain-containing protein [Clostridium chromiireducens]MVX62338.1 SIS domain-containing protein [Clostridium chromiireducens]
MIKLVIFDVDGVITDGSVIINENGNEQKKINLKDIDAIFELKSREFMIAAITGEKSPIVSYFEKRFPWDCFYKGKKNKVEIIKKIEEDLGIGTNEICYIGDGKYDVEPLKYAGLGICPADAIDRAKMDADIILQNKGGDGCLWELISILEDYNNEGNSHNYFYKRLAEHTNIFKVMASDKKLIDDVMNIGERIINLLKNNNQVFLCGNGGSAADAQHIATEFVSRFYKERQALNAEALTVNTSTLTAVGNDYSYEKVFVRQLEAKAKKRDILIGISTSGKSKNVMEALRYAKKEGIITVMLMGNYDNYELKDIADYVIKVPSKITPRIQEAHIFIGHLIAEYVEHKIFDDKGLIQK